MSRRARLLVRLVVVAVAAAALAVGGELLLRARVPACGVTPFRLSEVPGLGVELRPSFETTYKGFRVRTNALGMRGPEVGPKREGVLRVALVGDSFTYGSAVDEDGTLAASLQRALGERGVEAEVLNLGVPGYCALDIAAAAEHRLPELRPDVVLWIFYANDVDPPIEVDSIPEDAVIDPLHGFTLHSALLEWTRIHVSRTMVRLGRRPNRRTPAWSAHEYESGGGARCREGLTRLAALCQRLDARFAVATFPHLTDPALNPFRPIDERFVEDARAAGVPALHLVEAFGDDRGLLRHWADIFDHHPSGECNRIVAGYLAARLF